MLVQHVLHGFYATQSPVSEVTLEAFVRQHLPYYSVPERWIHIDSIPLTANGKVDRKELCGMILRRARADSGIDLSSSELKHSSIEATLAIQHPRQPTSDSINDLEKGSIVVTTKTADVSEDSSRQSLDDLTDVLPPKHGFRGLRWLRHRAFILYRRFFSALILTNIAVASFILYRRIGERENILGHLATATASNLLVAILMRSEPVVNLLFTICCSVPVCSNLPLDAWGC
jgi:hypothetical protein